MSKIQKILVFTNLAVMLLGAGVIYYSHFILKPEPINQDAEKLNMIKEAQDSANITPLPIKKFVVNLHSGQSRLRYLEVEMSVLPFSEDQKPIIKAHEYLLKDTIIEIASRLEPEELHSLSGKILLESKIKKQVNSKIGQPVIKQIYFGGFVVQ